MATIHDVAIATGVSDATVSRALRGMNSVRPSTRQLVLDAARRLDFTLSRSASSLASGKTMRVVMLFGCTIASWFNASCIEGALETLEPHGYDLVPVRVCDLEQLHGFFADLPSNGRNMDGFILPSFSLDDSESALLSSMHIPAVALDARSASRLPASVMLDNKRAMNDAVRFLRQLGHRRIGYVAHPKPAPFPASSYLRKDFFLDASNYYRYASHMTQVPVAYEYIDEGVDFEKELKGTYLDNYKALWDLEMKDNPTENTMLGSVNYEDSTAEFSTGRVAFYPNGVWAYSQIKDNDVADEDLAMLPYYMGFPNESKYAANSIYDISWSVNKNASEKDKKATLDFIKWMVTNDDAKKILAKDMGFAVPFTTFDSEDFQPDNPLTKSALKLESDGLTPIHGAYIPGQAWADGVANALLEYAQGTGDWNGVKKAYLDDWTSAWNDYESNFGMLPPVHK